MVLKINQTTSIQIEELTHCRRDIYIVIRPCIRNKLFLTKYFHFIKYHRQTNNSLKASKKNIVADSLRLSLNYLVACLCYITINKAVYKTTFSTYMNLYNSTPWSFYNTTHYRNAYSYNFLFIFYVWNLEGYFPRQIDYVRNVLCDLYMNKITRIQITIVNNIEWR